MRALPIWLLILAAIVMPVPLAAQDSNAPKPEPGHITGTVTDVNDDVLSGATVVLEGAALKQPRTVASNDNGSFEFNDLEPGTYTVSISAKGFADWKSPPVMVNSGQYVILSGSKLKIAEALTTVSVNYSPEEVATEQVKIEEQQRVFGIFPNFYVVYDHDPAPLTTKLKFRLALKTSTEPITFVGSAFLAGLDHGRPTSHSYGRGCEGIWPAFRRQLCQWL